MYITHSECLMLSGVTFDPTEHFFSQQEYINHNEMNFLPKSQDRMGLGLREILTLPHFVNSLCRVKVAGGQFDPVSVK